MAEPFPGPGGSLDPHGAADPIAAAAPQRVRWPSWTAPALILSGIVLVVVETPNLLFFLGLGLVFLGLYVWTQRRAAGPR